MCIFMIEFVIGSKTEASSLTDLFNSRFLLDDFSQRALLPYILDTQSLLTSAIKLFDTAGEATIVPSFDLGFTYNTGRLAGGFTTGMLVDWQCKIPFVPIDMTIKECSGSIILLRDVSDPLSFFTAPRINRILEDLKKDGYKFSFTSGNHFIMLSFDKHQNYYIIVHSGDDSYRDNENGVYPSPHVWYTDNIRLIFNSDKSRYLKYLIGEPAKKFVDLALLNRKNVSVFHRKFATRLTMGYCDIAFCNTYQHYGLYSDHTAVLGAGLVDNNCEYPIFSNEGLPIVMLKPSSKMWAILLDGKEKYLFPHGWGQSITNVKYIKCLHEQDVIQIKLYGGEILTFQIGYKCKIPKSIAQIRSLCNYNDFVAGNVPFESVWKNNFYADVSNTIYPLSTYSGGNSVKIWK